MDETKLTRYIVESFPHVETTEAYDYRFFFYRDDQVVSFVTIGMADSEYDRFSLLDRPGVYRLNIGVKRDTYDRLFGKERQNLTVYDFSALDTLMPHPVYAPQSFLCILNPSDATFETLKPLLSEAYDVAVSRYERKTKAD